MVKAVRWIVRIVLGLTILLALVSAGGYLWLRTSLPQTDGTLVLAGLSQEVTVTRDERGVPTIHAQSTDDAYFALGFVHAQDRLFQMDAMRRLGAGRLSEVIGANTLDTDRLMRTLGLYRSAEAQVLAASPALKAALNAYSAGVNAYINDHRGAWPPEFYLLNYKPDPWRPADSLVWGRLMALDLSGNWRAEKNNSLMKHGLPPHLFDLLVMAPVTQAMNDDGAPSLWRQPLNEASNSWVVGPLASASGKALIANDPHLALGAPAIWYLARLETPQMTWTGATAPGLPYTVIGTNGHVAWTFTTAMGDTQDLFEEHVTPGKPDHYETPTGPQPFLTRQETIKVKDAADAEITIRSTRHGSVVSDLGDGTGSAEIAMSLSWTGLLPDDRTPEAIMAINNAHDAAALEVALVDFHAPQQSVVYADSEGVTGFVAAGRVPLRRAIFADSRLPAPGWSGAYDWLGTLPMSSLPQLRGENNGFMLTANNDIRPEGYRPFLTADWPDDARAQRIRALLSSESPKTLDALKAIQMDRISLPVLAFVRKWQDVAVKTDPALAALLAGWDGSMDRDQAAPLVAMLWIDRTARHLLADEMRGHFADWWFWQIDRLQTVLADGSACDDVASPSKESCDDILAAALKDTRADLTAAYGADPAKWRWGDVHRAHFDHPVFRNVPVLRDWLDADLPSDGDGYTVNAATPLPPRDGAAQDATSRLAMPNVHGPGLRFLLDFAAIDQAQFGLAGGQSGNPLSPHYADWLADWRDGVYRTIVGGGQEQLVLQPPN